VAKTITTRQREILTAVVESYIATGEPVSSGVLAQTAFAHSMSSATIRNEMAELADAGLLEQPHTSAGRIPSAAAFRLYVGQLKANVTGLVRPDLNAHIDTSFAGVAGASALLERTSHILAALSSGVGLAIGAAASTDLLEHIHFSRLATRRVLAVVVTRSGLVRDRVLALDQDLSSVQLETAANFLNEHFRGWNVDRVRHELTRRIDHERTVYQQLADAVELWSRTVPTAGRQQQAVYVDGVANLIGLPEDRDRLRAMLAALEEKQRLIELLNAYIDTSNVDIDNITTSHIATGNMDTGNGSVRVIFDLDRQDPGMAGLVLIAAPARVSGDSTVAILGPKRMNYESAIHAVGYVAQLLHRIDSGYTASELPSPRRATSPAEPLSP
jgi:heat-inducible transcriptional repressor